MIGTLYRYPHPHDSTKFIYVGQTIDAQRRDKNHRSGRLDFGLRFKKMFPDVDLPQPILEQIEVFDQQELNWLETIWMFRYHTWRGYPDGMNLSFPGSCDYKTMGEIGGLATKESTGGRKRGNPLGVLNATREGQLKGLSKATFETRSRGGKKSGAQNLISGHIQALGRKNAESGHMVRISALGRTPEHQSEACRKRNSIYGNPQTTKGSKKGACGMWNIRHGKPCTCGQHLKVTEI